MEKLVMLLMMAGAMAVCPEDMDARKEEMKTCMEPLTAILTGTETNNTQVCSTMETTVKCIFGKLDDCGELAEHFVKPHILAWIMMSQALSCPDIEINGEPLQFDAEKGSNCSFFKFYTCNKAILDDMEVSPLSMDKQNVSMAGLRQWLTFNDMVMTKQEVTCNKLKDKDTDAVIECVDKLEKYCSPLGRPMPKMAEENDSAEKDEDQNNSTSGEDKDKDHPEERMGDRKPGPFGAMFLRRAVESCSDGCSGIAGKRTAFDECSKVDAVANSEEKNVPALVAAILENKGDNAKKEEFDRQCGVMKSFFECVDSAVGECKPLGDDVKSTEHLGEKKHTEALAACDLDLDDVGKTTSAAGFPGISMTIMVGLLLISQMV